MLRSIFVLQLVIVVILFSCIPFAVGGLDEGFTSYHKGDYVTAYNEFKSLAEDGVVDAQYNLGNMYRQGHGVTKNLEEAAKWYRKAAEKDNVYAQYILGIMNEKGEGIPKDYAEAIKWYHKAAEQGYGKAQWDLGFIYANGLGVPQDYSEAAKWYRNAALLGLAVPQYKLGMMYAHGQGVPQNYVLAHMWLSLAGSRGHKDAQRHIDLAAKKMTPEQIAEAQRLAREWKPKKPAFE